MVLRYNPERLPFAVKVEKREDRMKIHIYLLLAACLTFAGLSGCSGSQTPVQKYGRLHVDHLQLVSQDGKPVQLRGVSSYNIAGFDWLFGPSQLKELVQTFHAQVLRLAMYTDPLAQGYMGNPGLQKVMDKLIADTKAAGIYCIVDWHILRDGNPNLYKDAAVKFFTDLAQKYKDDPHLIFEICNEPNGTGVTWDGAIRPYAVDVLAAIRKSDPTRVVLVGTPTWSQDIDIAAKHPLDDPNVMYVFHWYAGSHGQPLRDKIDEARKTVPVFNSEWGATADSGTGEVFPAQTAVWLKFLDDRNISSCNWSFGNVNEGSASLIVSYNSDAPFKNQLTPSGKIVFDYLTAPRD